jgi:hypothetical protein
VAVTFLAAAIGTTQVIAVPLQAPLQPVKPLPAVAVAVRVTDVPARYEAEQAPMLLVAQEIPPVLEVTLPLPDPVFVIDNT